MRCDPLRAFMYNGKRRRQLHDTLRGGIIVLMLGLLTGVGLFGCSSRDKQDGAPTSRIDLSAIPDAVPRVEPHSRYGNPASYKVLGKRYHTLGSSRGYNERGVASWYGSKFHGRLTSSREPYNMYAMTAAHRTLPLPTYARVTNLRNGRSVVVKINDRGPFHDNRIIDLSYVAAAKLDIVRNGTGLVEVTAIDPAHPQRRPPPKWPKPAPPAQSPADRSPVAQAEPVQLYLQIGAFGSRFNAEQLQARIESAVSEQVRVQKLERDPNPLYRVRIGPLESVQLVDNLSGELQRELGLAEMHVVVE